MGRTSAPLTDIERLGVAIRRNDYLAVENLLSRSGLKKGLDPDEQLANGAMPMHMAAGLGHRAIMELLFKHKANINALDMNGNTPLAWAVEAGQPGAVAFLLGHGADPEVPDNKFMTPLMKAALADAPGMIADLLKGHANIETEGPGSATALMLAVKNGKATMVGTLLGHGAALDARDKYGNTLMHYAAAHADSEVMLQFLIGKGLSINAVNKKGETPVIAAIEAHNMENVQALLDLGADVMIADRSGMNGLNHARAIKRVKFREAMIAIFDNQGEIARRDMRKGAEHEVKVMKPLQLKRQTPS